MYTVPTSPGAQADPVVAHDAQLGDRPGLADGAGVREPLLGRGQRAAPLRGRVVLVDHRAPPFEHRPLHVDGAGRGAVDHVAQGRDVGCGALLRGERQQPAEMRRHHVAAGDAVARDAIERALRRPPVHQHHSVAKMQVVGAEVEHRRVVERRDDEVHAVALRGDAEEHQEHRQVGGDQLRRDIGERAAHALGLARGARGVGHRGAGAPPLGERGGLPLLERFVATKAGEIRGAEAGLVGEGELAPGARAGLDGGLTAKEGLGVAVGHDVGDLRRGEVAVDRREVEPGLRRGEVELEHRRLVAHGRGDGVTRSQAQRAQPVHHLVGRREELARGDGSAVRGDEGDVRWVLLGQLPEAVLGHGERSSFGRWRVGMERVSTNEAVTPRRCPCFQGRRTFADCRQRSHLQASWNLF